METKNKHENDLPHARLGALLYGRALGAQDTPEELCVLLTGALAETGPIALIGALAAVLEKHIESCDGAGCRKVMVPAHKGLEQLMTTLELIHAANEN